MSLLVLGRVLGLIFSVLTFWPRGFFPPQKDPGYKVEYEITIFSRQGTIGCTPNSVSMVFIVFYNP